MPFNESLKNYKSFHGKNPRKITKKKFHDPLVLTRLGIAHKIEYISNKLNGGGDGELAIYVHKFDPGATLYMDERNGKQLYILGSKITVNENGIVN